MSGVNGDLRVSLGSTVNSYPYPVLNITGKGRLVGVNCYYTTVRVIVDGKYFTHDGTATGSTASGPYGGWAFTSLNIEFKSSLVIAHNTNGGYVDAFYTLE